MRAPTRTRTEHRAPRVPTELRRVQLKASKTTLHEPPKRFLMAVLLTQFPRTPQGTQHEVSEQLGQTARAHACSRTHASRLSCMASKGSEKLQHSRCLNREVQNRHKQVSSTPPQMLQPQCSGGGSFLAVQGKHSGYKPWRRQPSTPGINLLQGTCTRPQVKPAKLGQPEGDSYAPGPREASCRRHEGEGLASPDCVPDCEQRPPCGEL